MMDVPATATTNVSATLDTGGHEAGPPGTPGVLRPPHQGRPLAHRRVASALATSASCRAR